ncbi:pyrroloquinoline quinone biosynthesis peptide chaperone PqqD [Ensifer soli]|uniref:pyrroloquinoline quinone biosynthesis peptide chaperone PqqD n=1 Tax=Ciceribacter sp. sgz301302 TaxID=3342379 RepID=UPI0035BB94AF
MKGDPVPVLPRGTRLHHDRVRDAMVLLAPERALMLDEIGTAILAEVDGVSTLSEISTRLAARYGAPEEEVAGDVRAFLDGFAVKRLVDYR